MPRSSPSTEDEFQEVDLDPDFAAPSALDLPQRPLRLRPIHLVGLLPALAIGLALVPRVDDGPLTLVSVERLPEPAVATTAAVLPARSYATLTNDTFDLLPVEGLGEIGNVVGPAALHNRTWLAATSTTQEKVLVFSSDDDVAWDIAVEIVADLGTIAIHDLEYFGGSLVILGTIATDSGPSSAFGYPDRAVIWWSSDGSVWNETTVVPEDGRNWHPNLTLATDGRALLVGARRVAAGGSLIDGIIPAELTSVIRAGQLDIHLNPGVATTVSVVAPPGIEVFRSDAVIALPSDVTHAMYRSENLRTWDEVAVPEGLIPWSGLTATPGRGFLAPSSSGEIYSTIDGVGWGRNLTIQPAAYRRWGEWLVGLDAEPGPDRLLIGAGTDFADIRLEVGSPPIWSEAGEVVGGPAGLASVVPAYTGPAATVSVTSGSRVYTLRNGVFSISTIGQSDAGVFFARLPGSYDPASGIVAIDLGDGAPLVPVDLVDLQGLRTPGAGAWETNMYVSLNAMAWSRSSMVLPGPEAHILGGTANGFLIAFRPGDDSSGPIEVYRTGPLPSGTNS